MFFSQPPWNFIKSYPNIVKEKKGIYCLYVFNSYIERFFIRRMKSFIKESLGKNSDIVVMLGQEITKEWIFDNLLARSLFGTKESYLVLLSEGIPSDSRKILLEKSLNIDDQYLILSFSVDDAFYKKLIKVENVTSLKISENKFYEGRELLRYLCREFRMTLTSDVEQFILDNIENSCYEFIRCLKAVSIDKNHSVIDLKSLVNTKNYNLFKMAQVYSNKDFIIFFDELLKIDDYSSLRGIFSFIQGHLYKVMDVDHFYSGDSNRNVSKYERTIRDHKRKWSDEEIVASIKMFAEFEVLSKRKDINLLPKIRCEYLKANTVN